MSINTVLTAVLKLIAGIGIFVIACENMSKNLESISSGKLKELFAKTSNNKLIGVLMGIVATAAIQSSGATMVMIIGFVNAGIMSLSQATTIMYGSDIGTTLTGQIVALGLIDGDFISTTVIFSSFVGVGLLISSLAKKDLAKKIGGILSGFGMLFIGLDMMSTAMNEFATLEAIKLFLASIKDPVLLAFLGAVMTAIIQSSSVMTSLSITMAFSGLINIDQGIYLTMGANVGSCVVGTIAALSANTNAKRTSFIQLIYNIGGVVLFLAIGWFIQIGSSYRYSYGIFLQSVFPSQPEVQLAMFHSLFNIISAIICLPLTEKIVALSELCIPDKPVLAHNSTEHLTYLDMNMLKTPSLAVEQVRKEILNMGSLAMENFNLAIEAIENIDLTRTDEFSKREELINDINEELSIYITELGRVVVDSHDNYYLSNAYHTLMDIERIGDYAENIIEYTEHLQNIKESFSENAKAEVRTVSDKVNVLYEKVMEGYRTKNRRLLDEADILEDEIDDLSGQMNINHIRRLSEGSCSADVGSKFLSMTTDIERIADHLISIATTIRKA